jgi:2-polyprenyl-3-methyl-5-hydroxy-6-metoxy-1,4-benzoquinol methylase
VNEVGTSDADGNLMNTTVTGENRFDTDAKRYADYLGTSEGRLRTELTFVNLQEVLPTSKANRSLRALDLGGGTGATSIRLARLGFHVTLLDSSPAMLDLAKSAIAESGASDEIELKLGDAAHVAEIFRPRSFDVILCHDLLEYVSDPDAVLRAAASVMCESTAILSVLVRNQVGDVMKAALQAGDLAAAEGNLSAEWGREFLYGGKARFFTPESLEAMLSSASLTTIARRGVRMISDYLPKTISRSEEYARIFALERKLNNRAEFYGIARYLQCLARREAQASEGRE